MRDAGFRSAGSGELTSGWIVGIVIVVVLIIILLVEMMKRWDTTSSQAGEDSAARVRLANSVTLGAMTFIVLVAVTILVFAGINAAIPPQGVEKTQLFFDMGKWIMGTILPVVGAWVGAVMAYYFGKENFKAGTENAERLVQQLTSDQKLDAHKAGDKEVGKEIDKADKLVIAAMSTLDATLLADVRTAFKNRERLPILDSAGHALACLHLNNLDKYEATIPQANRVAKTVADLIAAIGWHPADSFATVAADRLLSVVQALVSAKPECTDVFVTEDGTKKSFVKRWITNQDIVTLVKS